MYNSQRIIIAMHKFHNSIKTQLTLITVSFTLLATIIIVSVSLIQLQRMARANLLQSVEFNLHLVTEIISENIRGLDTLRLMASAHPETVTFLIADEPLPGPAVNLHARLTNDLIHNPNSRYVRRLIVTDNDLSRRVQVGNHMDKVAVTIYRLELLGDFSTYPEATWIGLREDPFSIENRGPIIPIVGHVKMDAGSRVGYIYLALSADIILAPLSAYQFPEGGNLYLLADNSYFKFEGNQLVHSDLQLLNVSPKEYNTRNAETKIIEYRSDSGNRYLAVFSPLGNTGMELVQTFPTQLFFQEALITLSLLIQICVGVLILGILVALYLSRIINRPIAQISKHLRAIAGGNFTPDPSIEFDNEFGEIGCKINQLARDLEALMDARLDNEKKKRDLEYKMLQSQINPHFLYNALNSIKWMATIQSADGIAQMTTSLSRLLKSLTKSSKTIVPLKQELSLLDDYFIIAHYRYGGSITMSQSVPEAFLNENVPVFTLQPLVENAIFHGIEPNGGVGDVRISAKKASDGNFEIIVEDNGIGMDEPTISQVFLESSTDNLGLFHHVGLYNVHTRIIHEFGAPYGLRVESKKDAFTRVIVLLPLNTGGQDQTKLQADKEGSDY